MDGKNVQGATGGGGGLSGARATSSSMGSKGRPSRRPSGSRGDGVKSVECK